MGIRDLFRLKWVGLPLKWAQCSNCRGKGYMTLKVDVRRHTSTLAPAHRLDANTIACSHCGSRGRVARSRTSEN
jgi:hypothetical protein